jgi:hypothetical protein
VLGEKHDGLVKGAVAKGGIGEKELLSEFWKSRLRVHQRRLNDEAERVKTLIRGFGNSERDWGKVVAVNLYYVLIMGPDLGRFSAHE